MNIQRISSKCRTAFIVANRTEKIVWIALDNKKRIQAFWCKGYKQPFNKWHKACKSLGYKPVAGLILI